MATSPRTRRYWLVKSEPDVFSFDDLRASPRRTSVWDGVRNYQARNLLRDDLKRGDLVFFYHSSTDPTAIVGIAEVVREGYPDPSAFESSDAHFDPKSRVEAPTWIAVDLKAVESITPPVTLSELRSVPALAGMTLLQRGSRLSVQPVGAAEWKAIMKMRPRRRR